MRTILVALMILGAFSTAQAQIRVERVDVMQRGLYKIEKSKTIKNKAISTGQRTSASTITFSSDTDTIRVGEDVVFGLDVFIHGRPQGRQAPFRIVWRYPAPGLRNPATGKVKLRDDYIDNRVLNDKSTFYWSLGAPWTQVPGEWTFEMWHGKRKLVSETFFLTK